MSNNIEDNIVSMQFDNKQFESGVATSLSTMDKLRSSLNFPDAGKGLADVNTAVSRFNMNPMASAIQGVSKLWLGLTTVAVTAISNITNKVVDAGLNLAKSFTIDPITQGFQEYEKNLNSIQTIMANTGASVKVTNGYLNDLNHYSDQTIYNFGQMADSIGKFTAAGVSLPDAVPAIKGMANSAALAGSDVNQLNTAMYQMSQALSTGVIRLMDWNSLANAGMGGANMRESLMKTAATLGDHGKAMNDAIASTGSFRDSLQAGWLTADIFNKTMKVMAGTTNKAGKTVAYSVKQLQGMGYSLQAAKDLNKLSAAAIDSATKVKTFTQLIDVVKESIGSGWSKVFQDLFGNFNQASKLWTSVSTTITNSVSNIFGSIDKVLVGWRKLGGFEDLWSSIGNIFKVLGNLIHPVIVLFQALTPNTGKAGSGLAKFTHFLATFTGWLVKLTDPIGNFSLKLGGLGKIFKTVGAVVGSFIQALKPLVPILQQVGSYIGSLFDQGMEIAGNLIAGWTQGLDPKALQEAAVNLANSWIQWIKDALGIHSPAATMVPIGENIINGIVEGLVNGARLMISALQKIFLGLGQIIKEASQNISWSDVLDTINTGLFLGVVLLFRRFVKTFSGIIDSWKAVMGSAGGVLDQLTSNLKTMQNEVRSEIIRNIALSVLMLAGAALLLSTLNTKKLGVALGAIAGLMTALVLSMRTITGGGKGKVDVKTTLKQMAVLNGIATALIAFSTAVLILSGAVALMGQLDPKTIEKGLAGVAGVIAIITTSTAILSKTGGGATILATATAMLIMSAALTAFVGVMKLYEQLDWKTLVRGGGAAAAVILGVGLAMRGFGKGAIGGSVGLVIASAALIILAKAMQMFAAIGVADMVKSVIALDFILASLATAAMAMSAAEGGAGSMLVMAAAIFVLAKALQIIGNMSVGDIVKAVVTIAVALALIAGAAILLSPAVPLIAALGTALLLLGVAVLAAGLGVLAFATALGIIAVVGPAAFQALSDGILQLLDILPKVGEAMGEMVVSFLTGLVNAAGPLVKALVKLGGIILDGLGELLPKVGHLIEKLVKVILHVIVSNQINAAKAMIRFVVGMLKALQDGVPKMTKAGTDLIIAIIQGLAKNAVKIANATGKAILDFLHGIDKAVKKYSKPIGQAGRDIAFDLVDGLSGGLLTYGMEQVQKAAQAIADHLPGWMKKVLGISSPSKVMRDEVGRWAALGVADGLDKNAKHVESSAHDLANKSLDAMKFAFNNSKKAANGLIDLQPKVSPVLDLTQLEKDATKIGSVMGSHVLDAKTSRRTARSIATDELFRNRHADKAVGGDTYKFEQIINSPKPVNHVKVYRGTKSQIALFREVTGK